VSTPPAESPPPAFSRPFGVILLGILNALGALLYLGLGAFLLIVSMMQAENAEASIVLAVLGGVLVVFGAFHAVTATGLFLLKGFGRICQMIQSGIGLLAIPLGTIVSALILYYLTRPGVALLFSGRAPAAMTPDERALVARDSSQGVAIVIGAVIALFGGVAVIGIVAAIAIPGLLRARMAGNEASAIGSLQAMSSAQATYASTHGGRFATVECLTTPSTCTDADADAAAPGGALLGASAAAPGPRSGYTFRLLLSDDRTHFVYWAEPAERDRSGVRRFCVTETFTVEEYVEAGGPQPPSDADEGCPAGGRSL
jgi:type II secretory pathway pseudopilin PulG